MNSKEKGIFVIGFVMTILFSVFLAHSTLGVRVDQIIHDQITDTHIRNEVIGIGIDDKSLNELGAWPWKRDLFAQALTILHDKGARLVVFDILFLEKREGDTALLKVLEANKENVVFASKLDDTLKFIPVIYSNSVFAKNGIAHVYPDEDGKVRTITFSQKDIDGVCHNSLAYEVFLEYTKQNGTSCDVAEKKFLYQAKLPKIYSFIDLLHGSIPENELQDKVVFIGSNTLDLEDHFVSQHGEKIPGLFVHAGIFTTLLNNSFLQPFWVLFYLLLLILFLGYSFYVVFRLKNTIVQGALIVGGATGVLVISIIFLMLHFDFSLSVLMLPYIFCSMYFIMFRYWVTQQKNMFIEELFGRYVNPKILATILKKKSLQLDGARKYITILFSDIRGFTTMTENMSPEELVETLNSYLETMSPLIMQHEGYIDKYIGDAIMAFWNAPIDVLNHEEKAVRASLEMLDALKDLQKKFPLEIGIGLHAGEAIVGNIGSRSKLNYTIIGDAVNACSRLEGLTKKYGLQIIASESIKNNVRSNDILWRSIDIVRVKGKREIMKLYEPLKKTEENEIKINKSQKAFTYYQEGELDKAITLYAEIGDVYSKKMIERIGKLTPETLTKMDGVWDWDEK